MKRNPAPVSFIFALFFDDLQKRMEKDGEIRINQQEMKRITTPAQGGSETGS